MVEALFDEIRGALSHNEQVKLSGFGNFDLRDKKERPGRNPKTGEEIPICVRRVVTFRPGQKLKAKVEAYVASSNKQMATDLKSVPARTWGQTSSPSPLEVCPSPSTRFAAYCTTRATPSAAPSNSFPT